MNSKFHPKSKWMRPVRRLADQDQVELDQAHLESRRQDLVDLIL